MKKNFIKRLKIDLKKNMILYLIFLPVLAYFIIFKYVPMYGILMAFKDYQAKLGIWNSPWVGFEHFLRFFRSYNFGMLIKNTLTISFYSLLVGFPIPIIFALFLNYLKHERLKKTIQMVSYAPHFISTVVMCGMITIFFNADTGIINTLTGLLGIEPVDFLGRPEWFKHLYVWTNVWQGVGWSAIIYISALSGVDSQLHEAAIIDGATKLQRMWYVDLPSIKPTIVMLLIMRIGSLMDVGFEKVFLLQNDLNISSSSIISTYVYQVGLINSDYGYSTAIGLFNTVINVILLLVANYVSKKLTEESLF